MLTYTPQNLVEKVDTLILSTHRSENMMLDASCDGLVGDLYKGLVTLMDQAVEGDKRLDADMTKVANLISEDNLLGIPMLPLFSLNEEQYAFERIGTLVTGCWGKRIC